MGRIILTIAAPWGKPPAFDTPLTVDYGPPVPALVDEFADLGGQAGTIDGPTQRAIEGHAGVLTALTEFDGPGDLGPAKAAARLLLDAVRAGALGVYVETGLKVFGPDAFDGLDPNDPPSLVHLFVDVSGDESAVIAEGLQAFDLPDIAVHYSGAAQRAAAQAAAFGLSARLVCDRFRLADGGSYRNTESAPLYRVRLAPPEGDADDPFVNPRGTWVLTPA